MGEKKQKEELKKKVYQVFIVGVCILFVVLMILSGMGSQWLTMFTVIKPGDTVVLDYTMYDAAGNPVMTSSQQAYTKAAEKGRDIIISRQLSMTAGKNLTTSVFPVNIYTSTGGWTTQYALFSNEYQAINQQLAGMKTGDQKRIPIPNSTIEQEWSAAQLANNSVNISDLRTGDLFALGVSDDPLGMMNSTSTTYTRAGEITRITNESVVVDIGYPTVEISVVAINPQS
jgi:FKBP-type peptidyl-prolyl cis-trans isomerase 2